jgi:hypothetical protein
MNLRQTALNTATREPLFTPKETAAWLRVSLSFLAKARMRGEGPPFIPIVGGFAIPSASLIEWTRSQQR